MQADVRNLDQKVISTASAVLHAPVQVCLGAPHHACVSVTATNNTAYSCQKAYSEPRLVLISYSTMTQLPHLFDNIYILSACD